VGAKYLSASGNTSAALAWFDIEQTNRVVDGATPGGKEQVGATTKGWEIEARHRAGRLELLGNYTQLDAVNAVTGTQLSSIAEKTAAAWTQYHFASGWRVGLGARHIGDVTGNAGTPVLPSVSLMDVMVGYSSGPWDVRLDVKNVADKAYVSWCRGANQDCGYGERLNAALNVRYRF
jgi:iron complex outermembrane receptor protein